jgi:hypothetical protein
MKRAVPAKQGGPISFQGRGTVGVLRLRERVPEAAEIGDGQ